ncbi:NAD(P)H-dependent oxidoreductase [Candidatus Uhrbacteria bacterium]|nr:NAD(P)H-dependent oxidoreductase [Candidatus Uhrbacteria bacterium]
MKKIIALSCSPSRGRNSDTMLDRFIAGARREEGVAVEKVYLGDIPVNDYRFENRIGPEPDEPEFAKLCEEMQAADALVIATPTYNFSVPGRLKNFIDRIRFLSLDFDRKTNLGQPVGKLGKLRTYFLVSGGTPTWAQKIVFFAFPPFWLRGVFLYFGAQVMGAYYSGDVRTFENEERLAVCEGEGRRFAHQVAMGRRHGILERIFWRPPEVE